MPNAQDAIVAPSKLEQYLLSASHPVGRSKAVFFNSLGFRLAAWQELASALKLLLAEHTVDSLEATPYGTKYRIRGSLTGPNGRAARVVTVWIIPAGERAPRFVTAFPEG